MTSADDFYSFLKQQRDLENIIEKKRMAKKAERRKAKHKVDNLGRKKKNKTAKLCRKKNRRKN